MLAYLDEYVCRRSCVRDRCRWSTGSNGDIWVLQIEPDDSSSPSPKHAYSALLSDDTDGPDGRSTRSPSVLSVPPPTDETLPHASRASAASPSSSGDDRSKSELVDLSVAHVIRCCRQPPWDRLLPVAGGGTWPAQQCSRRTTGGSHGWRVSAYSAAAAAVAHSPAELQRLLHVTSV